MQEIDNLIEAIRIEAQLVPASSFWEKSLPRERLFGSEKSYYLTDFLNRTGRDFVVHAYEKILKRPADENEIAKAQIQVGDSQKNKIRFILGLFLSPEARKQKTRIKIVGLDSFMPLVYPYLDLKSDLYFSIWAVVHIHGITSKQDLKYFYRSLKSLKASRIDFLQLLMSHYTAPMLEPRKQKLGKYAKQVARICVILWGKTKNLSKLGLSSTIEAISHMRNESMHANELAFEKETAKLKARMALLEQKLTFVEQNASTEKTIEASGKVDAKPEIEGFRNPEDYFSFEEKFRGSANLVKERLSTYLPLVESVFARVPQGLALDIGFGRGEWLELLKERNIPVVGADMNPDLVDRARQQGHSVICADANEFLKSKSNQKFGLITAFHLVEHMDFESLQKFIKSAYDGLEPGGVFLIETPNPENILVGSYEFWLDPTHVKPYPAPVLQFLFESVGFKDVQVRKLHPAWLYDPEGIQIQVLKDILFRFNLDRDSAVFGVKPF